MDRSRYFKNMKYSLLRINVKPVLSYFICVDNYKNLMFVCDDLVKYYVVKDKYYN